MSYILITSKGSTSHELVEEVLEHKPETWAPYGHEKGGLLSIIKMEYIELMKAVETRPHEEIVTALAHLAAATTHALDKMTC